MGLLKGTISGLSAVAGGVAAMPFGGIPAFIIGAMAGTIFADAVMALFGTTPRTGRNVGIMKGIAASVGSLAGMPFGGLVGMMAGAFAGSLTGDLLGL